MKLTPYLMCFCLTTLGLMSSCGSVQKLAMGTTATIFKDASKELETENNFRSFKKSVPANLKLTEGLLYLDPDNEDLLMTLTKGYAGYAFAIYETQHMEERFADKERPVHKAPILQYYTRAIQHGLTYLEEEAGISYQEIVAKLKKGELSRYLDDQLGTDDESTEFMFYFAQALGGYLNYQRDDIKLMTQIGVVKALFDWTCDHRPQFNFGACDIFYGTYMTSRPKMLGGNPEEGEKRFLQAMKRYPHNWLITTSYLEFVLIPQGREKEFMTWMKKLADNYQVHDQDLYWRPIKVQRPEFKQRHLRFFQTLAMERYQILKKYQTELF